MDLALRARERGIEVKVIHNASIMNAMGASGLQLYNFGRTVTVPFFTESWRPDSFYDKIAYNLKGGMHTLVLLGECSNAVRRDTPPRSRTRGSRRAVCVCADIKVKEHDYEALTRGIERFLPPRFMTVNTALKQLREIEERRGEGGVWRVQPACRSFVPLTIRTCPCLPFSVLPPSTRFVGLARVGQDTQKIVAGTLEELVDIDFGAPLHSVIIVGETHELEDEVLASFSVAKTSETALTTEAVTDVSAGAGGGDAAAAAANTGAGGAGAGDADAAVAAAAAAKATTADAEAGSDAS